MAVLLAGGLAVAGLVAWAVTRSMDAPTQVATPPAVSETAPVQSTSGSIPPPDPMPFDVTNSTSTTQPAFPPAPTDTSNLSIAAGRIEVEQLKQQVAAGAVTVVDVRDSVSYSNGHIPGALLIPFARIETESAMLPKGKPVVTYCT